MTKKELVKFLWDNGDIWANESYSKKDLEQYVEDTKRAQAMSFEELRAEAIRRSEANKRK